MSVDEVRKFLSVYLGIIFSHYIAEGKTLSEIIDVCVLTNQEDFSKYHVGKVLIENKDQFGTYFPCPAIQAGVQ